MSAYTAALRPDEIRHDRSLNQYPLLTRRSASRNAAFAKKLSGKTWKNDKNEDR
jgi:hypothetical protein